MSQTKKLILELLQANGGWLPAGQIARAIHEVSGGKESQIERRCRELCNSGVLEKRYNQVDGKGPHFVEYRFAEHLPHWRPTSEELKQNRLI
jgi:DNA-binding Lrp family transcriptional regulator